MESSRTSLNGYRMDAGFRNVPVAFVNALRRILLADIPTVVISNVQILENSSSMTHEMLRHRMEMLPVNVKAEEAATVRDTKIEIHVSADKTDREITSDDFQVVGPRKDVLLKDRDLDTPMLFARLKPGESLHIKCTLSIMSQGASQVCVSTFRNHIDADVAKVDRDTFVAQSGDDLKAQREAGAIFDNFHIQRSYSRNKETGRPDWFDFTIESIGVSQASDLMRKAVEILQAKILEFVKTPIQREADGWYRLEVPGETHTVGRLAQEMIYIAGIADYVSADTGHPLIPKLTLRFHSKSVGAEEVIEKFKTEASALCENVLKSV